MSAFTLEDFVRESNRIDGITRDPTTMEIDAHEIFLCRPKVSVSAVEDFVTAVANKILRDKTGMNVRFGNHTAPFGGPEIRLALNHLLDAAYQSALPQECFFLHRDYETLHPFMDGNGRSGRVLWLWMMGGIDRAPLGFLHHWYYQSLSLGRAP